jgi:hypothetical protein
MPLEAAVICWAIEATLIGEVGVEAEAKLMSGENKTLTRLEAIPCVLAHCSNSARLKSSIVSLRFRRFF